MTAGNTWIKRDADLSDGKRAVDPEGKVQESFVTKKQDKKAALIFLRKAMFMQERPEVVVTDRLRSYRPPRGKSALGIASQAPAGETQGGL
ncbi:DDE domain-containing protein [Ruegeria marina]|uniref:DDE domain-containing protein n=1 Tax=Ruegeria marina TaxID=639004 RepID=A0A1G6VQ94_9RHOB|nr:DDE domain-containing protein [Ruegeria marina]